MKFARRNLIPLVPLLALVVALTCPLQAQTNEPPVRLGIIAEPEAAAVADLLTVELSAKPQLQILEREQIEKVYREQGLSAANRDYVKMGQVLGAEGLLLMGLVAEGTNNFVSVRLVAVKPGVVIGNVRTPWPVPDAPGWARWVANHFTPLLPKLSVSAKDAIPISVVALRSAVNSAEARELERQLTVLTIERLTRERELFVLERRRMDLLSVEKELRGMGESEFWSGSYLLDGTLDRDGYSKDTLTVHAQLAAPRGEAPVQFEVHAGREALSELVNAIGARVTENLKLKYLAPWSASDEAVRFADEAEWALKWGMIEPARSAADAAWALGKHDLPSALTRVRARIAAARPDTGGYSEGIMSNLTGDPSVTDADIRKLIQNNPERVALVRRGNDLKYRIVSKPPQPAKLDAAQQLLELYEELSRVVATEKLTATNTWYLVGVEALVATSEVLQHFHFSPKAQQSVAEKLSVLRTQARLTAAWISESPGGQDVFWTPSGPKTHQEYARGGWGTSIQACKIQWGFLWQERPEDALELYRSFLRKPVLATAMLRSISSDEPQLPRVAAWTSADRNRLPAIWEGFLVELGHARGLALSMDQVERLSPNDPVLSLSYEPSSMKNDRANAARSSDPVFELCKAYLKTNAPYEFTTVGQSLLRLQCSNVQAAEFLPLVAAYQSNLLGQVERKSGQERANLQRGIRTMETVRLRLQNTVDPSAPLTSKSSIAFPNGQKAFLTTNASVKQPRAEPASPSGAATFLVHRFLPIPQDVLRLGQERESLENWIVLNRRVHDDRLWLDVRCESQYLYYTATGSGWRKTNLAASAVLNLRDTAWEIEIYPAATGGSLAWSPLPEAGSALSRGFKILPGNRQLPVTITEFAALQNGTLLVSGVDYLRKLEFTSRSWETQKAPWQSPSALFVLGSRVFAANTDTIFELLNGTHETHILASCRRKPAASALDSFDAYDNVTLLPGPGSSVRAVFGRNIYAWDGRDWTPIATPTNCHRIHHVEVCDDATLLTLSRYGENPGLWALPHDQDKLELCLADSGQHGPPFAAGRAAAPDSRTLPSPIWKVPELTPRSTAAAITKSKLLVYVEHCSSTNDSSGRQVVAEKDGRHADLVCLERGNPVAVVLPLKFNFNSTAPLEPYDRWSRIGFSGKTPTWLSLSADWLLLGQTGVPGVWAIPRADLDAAIARERTRLAAAAQIRSQP